ncbi:MAG TPA: hypothetical protein VFU42_09465 [Candidatus Deferrimicrobiaceae bacterium]|nr:hypothetical protein [Candidatus Deferrimicrobiaceae bacterium]
MKKILLLPFCLAKEDLAAVTRMAEENGYSLVVANSTAKALSEVRRHASPRSREAVRIVGVVCEGRAKKVWLGLVLLKLRQWGKVALGLRTHRIELARVAIVGGTKAFFGRRSCRVGFNVADREGLRRALEGKDTFMRL